MAQAPGKLRFTILSCTGEDPDYPARELLHHSPQTRGWQCPRFSKFPQEITLLLDQPSKIHQIQILSHEYKIATKLELYVGMTGPGQADPSRAQMRRLGHLSFDSNDRSGHQARELKSVHVNTTAVVFKLVVQRCHINKLNIYNQVGIVALNLIGEPLDPQDIGAAAPTMVRPTAYPTGMRPAADMGLDMNVDSKTAATIRELYAEKQAAVAAEDYDEAKRIKGAIDRLKSVGAKIGQLEAKKVAAVEREDYDMAKQLKYDIEKLRIAAKSDNFYAGGAGGGPARSGRSNNPQDIFDRVLDAAGPPPGMEGQDQTLDVSAYSAYSEAGLSQTSPMGGSHMGQGGFDPESMAGPDGVPPPGGNRLLRSRDSSQPYVAYDERPAMGKGAYRLDSPSVRAQEVQGGLRAEPSQSAVPGGPTAPPGFPPDLPAPEPLNSADAALADPLMELLGEYTATCLFSKNWQLREAGMQMIEKQLSKGELPKGDNTKEELRQLTKAVCKALKDKVANVFQGGMSNMRTLLDTYGQHVGGRDLQHAASDFVSVLFDKLGDNNSRTQASAQEGILFLAAIPGVDSVIAPQACKPAKSQTAWKQVLVRLALLLQLSEQFGVSSQGSAGGLPMDGAMKYVAAALSSPNGEVRSAAIKCAVDVFRNVGDAMRSFLPEQMNKALRDQLELALEEAGDGPPPERPPQKAPVAKPKQAPAKPKPTQAAAPKPAASSHPAPPEPSGQAALEESMDDPGALDEDPAVYERELAQREKDLGPEHPDVAESLSNLAILYNQQGDYDKAQPLYERALAIWEESQGPDSSDVAHTLTDLAVLHLEQGRDEVGRPLLERALVIQRKNLGEDHPDVIAILEVLESE